MTGQPMRVMHAPVVQVVDLTPAMRRIVFGGPNLVGYPTTGVGDEYVRILFPLAGEERPPLPDVAGDDLDYSTVQGDRLRTYTIRDADPERGLVTVDFVVHDGGLAASWAKTAQVGDVIGINTPKPLYDPPEGLQWQVLLADNAGLPAALRLVELTPAHVRTRLVLEVAEESHKTDLPAHPLLETTWIVGGNGHGPSCLDEAARGLQLPDGIGYVWIAGETKTLRGARKHLRRDLGLPASAYKALGYWTADAERWRERFAALDEATRAELDAMWDSGDDPEDIADAYEDRLDSLGL
ncbi:siderophore-interacting protein [Glycomyces harbinensis]|uniref:NADPH-dependent ferric siderophore reductase, contains FAD-binding and SIP domains n=1 Tax=Glycomyces harbinensis TaxID=58114 RepID=A0A1G6QYT3_9ACTN|nr:siderophore-interacting protein [Glycomyces harbinensis]SDC96816.1 NADPH-dependent ferric siderophore reductase, contains FAD-binding and SIP domains [Glycomyces harbinensis]